MKITFLGSDSTHTEFFARAIAKRNQEMGRDEATITSLWGEDFAQAERKSLAIPGCKPCRTIEEALGGADLAMVIGRFADSHFSPAKTALKNKIKTFVDKPFVNTVDEADSLLQLSESYKTPLFSSSPLRFCAEMTRIKKFISDNKVEYAEFHGPETCIDLQGDARFDSTLFYGIHAAEMMLEAFGFEMSDLKIKNDRNFITAEMKLKNIPVSLRLIKGIEEHYSFNIFGKTASLIESVKLDASYYSSEIEFILNDFYAHGVTKPLASTRLAISMLSEMEMVRREPKGISL